jgi:transcriptional regulator with XRE-family HTH domain
MNIQIALRTATEEAGWSLVQLAYEAGVSATGARKWILGISTPSGDKLEILRAKLPLLRRLLDEQSSSIRVDDIPKAA